MFYVTCLKRISPFPLLFSERFSNSETALTNTLAGFHSTSAPIFLTLLTASLFLRIILNGRKSFFTLSGKGATGGTLFRSSFGKVVDGSPGDIVLSNEEYAAYAALTSDNGETQSWFLLKETVLVEHGLSPVSEKGKNFLFFIFPAFCCVDNWVFLMHIFVPPFFFCSGEGD